MRSPLLDAALKGAIARKANCWDDGDRLFKVFGELQMLSSKLFNKRERRTTKQSLLHKEEVVHKNKGKNTMKKRNLLPTQTAPVERDITGSSKGAEKGLHASGLLYPPTIPFARDDAE